ncbi:MAG: DUF2628 domain-containing protein [Hyphomicrobiaceae bacterium]
MIVYTVHEPPDPPADRLDRGERLVFVKDGFSWSAALFAPLWMIPNRLWRVLIVYLLVVGALYFSYDFAKTVIPGASGLAVFALHTIIGFEAAFLKRWGLARRGWRDLGPVAGRSAAECERRFFDAWLPHEPAVAMGPADTGVPPRQARRQWFAGKG